VQQGIPLKVEELGAIESEDYHTPAKRPKNSRLDCNKLKAILGVSLPDWKEGLAACMELKGENHRHADPRA
jgi:dTDP-4-dehydrorhamnose reductase